MVWYENYRWKSNPFVIDPIPDTFMLDDIHSKVMEAVYSGDILNLYGQTGTGKTSLLHMLEERLRGRFVPVYIDPLDLQNYAPNETTPDKRQYEGFLNKLKKDALRSPSASIRKLLGRTLLENLKTTYKGSKLVLLIDEAKDITDPTIPSYFRSIKNSGADCAMVITSIEPVSRLPTFTDSLRDVRVSYLQMRTVTLDEARLMLSRRIELVGGKGIGPFDEKTLDYLVEVSNQTPILILKHAEDVLKYLSFNGRSGDLKVDDIASALAESSPRFVQAKTEPKPELLNNDLAVRPTVRPTSEKVQITETPAQSNSVPFDNLTDTQKKIVIALKQTPLTAEELCKILGVKYGSIFPELYRLMLLRDADRMKKKGITRPILSKTTDSPAKYILDVEWKMGLVKE